MFNFDIPYIISYRSKFNEPQKLTLFILWMTVIMSTTGPKAGLMQVQAPVWLEGWHTDSMFLKKIFL